MLLFLNQAKQQNARWMPSEKYIFYVLFSMGCICYLLGCQFLDCLSQPNQAFFRRVRTRSLSLTLTHSTVSGLTAGWAFV
jgi:hypothetical protein